MHRALHHEPYICAIAVYLDSDVTVYYHNASLGVLPPNQRALHHRPKPAVCGLLLVDNLKQELAGYTRTCPASTITLDRLVLAPQLQQTQHMHEVAVPE